jgi:hypothetical protein
MSIHHILKGNDSKDFSIQVNECIADEGVFANKITAKEGSEKKIDLDNCAITNAVTGTEPSSLVNKEYVDLQIAIIRAEIGGKLTTLTS